MHGRSQGSIMGSILLLISLFGCWLVISSLLDWDWSFGAFDHYPIESTLGTEVVRWGPNRKTRPW